MEAIKKKERIVHTTIYTLVDKEVQLDYYYRSISDVEAFSPELLIINYDGELTEEVIKSVITGYSGTYKVFHSFKTDMFFMSDVTQYMKDIFPITHIN